MKISEEEIELLRELVALPESEIESEFNKSFRALQTDIKKLGEVRQFLKEKLLNTTGKFAVNIERILHLLEQEIARRDETVPLIEKLGRQIAELNEKKKHLDEQITELKSRLGTFLFRNKTLTQNFEIIYYEGKPYLKIIDKSQVPSEFMSLQPDRHRMDKHFKSSGEILPGTERKIKKNTLIVKRRKS